MLVTSIMYAHIHFLYCSGRLSGRSRHSFTSKNSKVDCMENTSKSLLDNNNKTLSRY